MPRPEELRREAVRRAEDRTREETRDLAVRLLQLQLARLQASLRGEGPGPGEAVDAYRQMHLDLAELDAPTGQAFGELVTYWRSLASLG
ncbi:hypothetical protein [Nocardioides sp.]|uniref:hypothetical protein n=1 Tax=Nocardioides sp. TaxID=35761 RepID=UPI00271805A9|nr:hypothetical protein [Nocardioides sp.]MDO9457697.1 hypothetical protein [Nocardioides sp.]